MYAPTLFHRSMAGELSEFKSPKCTTVDRDAGLHRPGTPSHHARATPASTRRLRHRHASCPALPAYDPACLCLTAVFQVNGATRLMTIGPDTTKALRVSVRPPAAGLRACPPPVSSRLTSGGCGVQDMVLADAAWPFEKCGSRSVSPRSPLAPLALPPLCPSFADSPPRVLRRSTTV